MKPWPFRVIAMTFCRAIARTYKKKHVGYQNLVSSKQTTKQKHTDEHNVSLPHTFSIYRTTSYTCNSSPTKRTRPEPPGRKCHNHRQTFLLSGTYRSKILCPPTLSINTSNIDPPISSRKSKTCCARKNSNKEANVSYYYNTVSVRGVYFSTCWDIYYIYI